MIAERNAREEKGDKKKGNRIKRKEKKMEITEKSIEWQDFEKLERKWKEKIKKYKEKWRMKKGKSCFTKGKLISSFEILKYFEQYQNLRTFSSHIRNSCVIFYLKIS